MRRGRLIVATAALGCALLLTTRAAPQGQAPPVVTSLTLFAGSPAGLWRSRDWGATWELARPGPMSALLPLGPRVYAGGEGGLALSDDFGQSWKAGPVEATVLAVLPSRYPQADPTVFLGTGSGLLKSADGGMSFRPTPLTGAAVHRLEWPGPDLVVATGRGVMVSSDAAATFRGPGAGMPVAEVRALALSSFFAVDPVIFAGVGDRGVFRSSDAGATWTAAGLDGKTVRDLVWLGPLLYAATDQGLFRSENAGRAWSPLGEGLNGRAVLRLLFPLAPASGAEAFAGTDKGIFRTTDGGLNWTRAGLSEERILCLATFPPPAPVLGGKRRRR